MFVFPEHQCFVLRVTKAKLGYEVRLRSERQATKKATENQKFCVVSWLRNKKKTPQKGLPEKAWVDGLDPVFPGRPAPLLYINVSMWRGKKKSGHSSALPHRFGGGQRNGDHVLATA